VQAPPAADCSGLPLSLLVASVIIPDAPVFDALLDDIPQDSDAGWYTALAAR
jgi:hypothetical protein